MKRMLTMTLAALLAAGTIGAAPGPQSSAPQPVATIHVKDFAFHPPALTIHAGDAVLFINDDGDAHTVTAVDKTFDSGGLDTNERWIHVFAKPGTYAYFCALHPYMKAVVVVLAAASKAGP